MYLTTSACADETVAGVPDPVTHVVAEWSVPVVVLPRPTRSDLAGLGASALLLANDLFRFLHVFS